MTSFPIVMFPSKYDVPYKGPFYIAHNCRNSVVVLQCVAIKIGCNIRRIISYTSDAKVEDHISEK